MNGIHEVTGSIPVWSTNLQPSQQNQLELGSAGDGAFLDIAETRLSRSLSSCGNCVAAFRQGAITAESFGTGTTGSRATGR
jgi:hypothetical protein